nr:Chain C, Nuclear receptor-interacting protein 1 [Homo sapiens]4S15_C Chain C, Nuclear receptor-interacting protein 1 [Homo sapiens]4S15_D Chain D, Nuclear receptor-interacting protein 1 [Homo sapiens]
TLLQLLLGHKNE